MSSEKLGLIGGVGDGRRGGKAGRAGRKPERLARLDVLASWGAALRSRAAGSQDELRCSAIHKQRPYRVLVFGDSLKRTARGALLRRAVPRLNVENDFKVRGLRRGLGLVFPLWIAGWRNLLR